MIDEEANAVEQREVPWGAPGVMKSLTPGGDIVLRLVLQPKAVTVSLMTAAVL